MAKAKKKAAKKVAKKAARKAGKTKTVGSKTSAKRKSAAATRGKSSKKVVKKSKAKKAAPRRAADDGVRLGVSLELDNRLRDLATAMNKSLEEILLQALTEFADNWEDHMNTVSVLSSEDDRVQLAVRDED